MKDSIRDFEVNLVVCIFNEKGKERNVREVDISKLGFGFLFEINYFEDSGVDVRDFNDFIIKLFFLVLLEIYCIENGLEWYEYMKIYLFYLEKLW